jgi:hypothetical protein
MGEGFKLKDSDSIAFKSPLEGYVALTIRAIREMDFLEREVGLKNEGPADFFVDSIDSEYLAHAFTPLETGPFIPYFQNKKI